MSQQTFPIRPITRGPRFHWFGYYDKHQFGPAGRYVLGMEVDFEHRSPPAGDGRQMVLLEISGTVQDA